MNRAEWQERAEREIGRPMESLDFRPVPDVRIPALATHAPPTSRGRSGTSSWKIASVHAGIPETIAASVQEAIAGGVDVVRIDVRASRGARDLGAAVSKIVDTHGIELTHSSVGDAAALVALTSGLRKDLQSVRFDFGLDPIGTIASNGHLQGTLEAHVRSGVDAVAWSLQNAPNCTVFTADGTVWHNAGADEAWAIAMTLASGIYYLRAINEAGLPLEEAFTSIRIRQGMPGRFFLGIAKLRATRRLIARIAELCNLHGSWAQTACPAWRERTERDAPINILRNTAGTFAAIVGGASRIDVPGHQPGADAERLARNTQHILREEARLGSIVDPAGGSYALESLTEQLAQAAWKRFQEIEAEGGMFAALESGFIQAQLKSCSERADLHVRTRKHPILGVTRFPDLDGPKPVLSYEDELPTSIPGGLQNCSTFASLLPHALKAHSSELTHALVGSGFSRVAPLFPQRLAEPFERMRDRGDRDPREVFIATIGPLAEHTARTAFGREFVEAGGLHAHIVDTVETIPQAVHAMHASKCHVAILSMSDKRLQTEGVEAVRALVGGSAKVWCLGKPGPNADAMIAAGLRGFFSVGTDLQQSLLQLWEHA